MLVSEICYHCGIEFGVPAQYQKTCMADSKKTFYCPNGHGQVYRESEADKLRRELNIAKQQAARRDDEIRQINEAAAWAKKQAASFRGVATKLKKRVKAGTCPCCNRTFSALAQHIATQHPDYDTKVLIPEFEETAS